MRLRQLPPTAWILFGGTFINRFGTFVMPMLAMYLTRNGYSIAQSGIAIGAYGAGHLATSLLGGHLADRIGRRNTIALSMFASAGTMLALSQARSYGAIVALTFAAGLSTELYRPASSALLADVVAPEQRVLAFGLYRFAINLGFAVGPATAGFLAERSFFYVFLGDAISSFAFGVIALLALPHGVREPRLGGTPRRRPSRRARRPEAPDVSPGHRLRDLGRVPDLLDAADPRGARRLHAVAVRNADLAQRPAHRRCSRSP